MSSKLDEPALLRRMLPESNTCRRDRAEAWQLWQEHFGRSVLRRFIRLRIPVMSIGYSG